MRAMVVDASATLPWCFRDEASDWSRALLIRLRSGEPIAVPAHWATEVANGLLSAERRGRIPAEDANAFLDDPSMLPIDFHPALTPAQGRVCLALARKRSLTLYDAAYLELALRLRSPLATLDSALRKAALSEGVELL